MRLTQDKGHFHLCNYTIEFYSKHQQSISQIADWPTLPTQRTQGEPRANSSTCLCDLISFISALLTELLTRITPHYSAPVGPMLCKYTIGFILWNLHFILLTHVPWKLIKVHQSVVRAGHRYFPRKGQFRYARKKLARHRWPRIMYLFRNILKINTTW